VFVVLVGDVYSEAQDTLAALREMELNVAVGEANSKLDKQIKAAAKKDIKYALFIGEKELKSGQFLLKNLQSGEEESHSIERLVSLIKDIRKR
jgi:histidyl-tRNA synthetase